MTQLQQKLVIPGAVLEKLDSVRSRTFRVSLGTAIVAALGVLLAGMGLAMLIDWLATLYDSSWRTILTYSALAATGTTFFILIAIAWRHSRRLGRVAAQVDREVPQLEERWSTVAQLSETDHPNDVHPAMYRQVAREANQWSPRIEVQQVVPLDRLIWALLCLTAITAVLGFAVIFDSHRTTVLLRRFWSPSSTISATEFAEVSGDAVVGRGESFEIAALVEGSPVARATLLLEPSGGDPQTITLMPRGDQQVRVSHRIRSVKMPLQYRLRAGDGQTRWHQVRVADRPTLKEVRLTIIPPAYTKQQPTEMRKLPRKITAMEGSVLQLALKPREPITSAVLQLGNDKKESLAGDKNGWYRWQTTLSENLILSPLLTEANGLTNRRPPKCEVTCRPDAPPVVHLISPENAVAVQPADTIPITFTAKDDVGIGSAELVLYGEGLDLDGKPVPLATIPIPLGDQQGAAEIQATIDLDLSQYELADGTEISYAVRVNEGRSNEELSAATGNQPPEVEGNDSTTPESPAGSQDLGPTDLEPTTLAQADSAQANPAQAVPASTEGTLGGETPTSTTKSPSSRGESPPRQENLANTSSGNERSEGNRANREKEPPSSTKEGQANQSERDAPEDSPGDVSPDSGSPDSQSPETVSQEPDTTTERSASVPSSKTSEPPAQQKNDSSQAASGQQNSSPATKEDQETPAPSKPSNRSQRSQMLMRQLDVPQPQATTSSRMLLKIDETAGSFSGRRRIKLEMAISPRLHELEQALKKAQQMARGVLDDLPSPEAWDSKHGRDVTGAERQITAALKIVDQVEGRSQDTPYAFVGLQLVDIRTAHIEPARRDFWKALQTEGKDRVEAVRNGWQHTGRALELLERLTMRFERSRREYALAESVERIKKMYQVYVENALALLRPGNEGSPYSRKRVEFDLDEEYLARLKEVIEMRNAMRAELARILAEDPRLLRRYLDAQRNREKALRNELAELTEQQRKLNRKTKAWTLVEKEQRDQLALVLRQRHVRAVEGIALAAADLYDRFETWLPLERKVDDADLMATAELLQQIATATSDVSAAAGKYIGQQSRPKKSEEKTSEETSEESESEQLAENAEDQALAAVVEDAEKLYDYFNRLEVLLRQIGLREEGAELASFATNRLLETRRLLDQTSAWLRQLKSHQAGEVHRADAVEQYRLAMTTDSLAGKLADIEQRLVGLLQRDDEAIPKAIAEKARTLLATLDEQVTPNQLAAVYALRRKQLPRATSRQAAALKALELAGRTYDEMIELTILELDKLPVSDPIASILREPTLDELLRDLEQEIAINEILGIPNRPTNLEIIGDWMRPGGDNAIATGSGGNQLLINQFLEQQRRRQQAIEQAYRRALEKAKQEAKAADLVETLPARATKDWNVLASQLQEDLQQGSDSAPPERYRQAIEQYFRQISGSTKEAPSLPK